MITKQALAFLFSNYFNYFWCMQFQDGNEYWKVRTKDGRDKIFKNPEELADACNEYFKWLKDNPLMEVVPMKVKISRDEEEIRMVEVPKLRPYTIEGLCNYIDISVKTFHNYAEYPEFLQVVTRVRQIIYNQKFEGAASGFLNPNIIARDLGLVDKKESTVIQEQPIFGDDEDRQG